MTGPNRAPTHQVSVTVEMQLFLNFNGRFLSEMGSVPKGSVEFGKGHSCWQSDLILTPVMLSGWKFPALPSAATFFNLLTVGHASGPHGWFVVGVNAMNSADTPGQCSAGPVFAEKSKIINGWRLRPRRSNTNQKIRTISRNGGIKSSQICSRRIEGQQRSVCCNPSRVGRIGAIAITRFTPRKSDRRRTV